MSTAYITQTDTPFGEALAKELTARGFRVHTGDAAQIKEKVSSLDLFIATQDSRVQGDGADVRQGLDPGVIMQSVEENLIAPLRALETLLPLLDAGEMKRLCFLSGRDASINWNENCTGFGYSMSKAALSNLLQMVKNKLRPDGYSLRVFDPLLEETRITLDASVSAAATYFLRDRAYDPHNQAGRNDEERLVMRDALGRECPW